jgi:hypothetical protein
MDLVENLDRFGHAGSGWLRWHDDAALLPRYFCLGEPSGHRLLADVAHQVRQFRVHFLLPGLRESSGPESAASKPPRSRKRNSDIDAQAQSHCSCDDFVFKDR